MDDELLEKLAELEHIQWCEWAKSVYAEIDSLLKIISKLGDNSNIELNSNEISTIINNEEKLKRWDGLFIPYSDLPDSEKEKDRVYAKKVHEILEKE